MRSTGDSFETALGEDSVPDPDGPAVSLAGAPVGDPPRAKSPRGGISWLLVSQLVLGLLVVSTTGMLVVQLRQQALTASSHEIQSLALTLADQAERAFDGVDLLQTTFMETVRADRIETPGQFRQRMSGSEVNQQLIAHARMLPQLDTIALIDADGMFINYNHALPVPSNSIADRSYFKALKPDSGPPMVVSEPIVNRMDQSLAVVVAHRITSTTGAFLGISFAGVRMNYFESLYQTVANKEDTAIALTRTDGVLFARYPHISATIGKSFMQAGIVAQMVDNRAASEVIRKVSQVNGVDRLIAGHTLSHFPLVVSVSASVSSILRPWREEAVYLIGSAAIMELMVVGVGLLMQRQLRSQRLLAEARAARAASDAAKTFAETAQRGAEAELALGQERERADRELRVQAVRFGAALGNMSEVVCLFDATDRLVVGNDRLASMLYLPAGSITPGMTITDMGDLLPETSGLPPTDPRNIHSLILRVKDTGDRGSQMLDTENGRIAVNFAPMAEDGWLVTLEDITEQRRSEAKIEHMAHHDALTGLANRVLFHYPAERGDGTLPARRAFRGAVPRPRPLQGGERYPRPSGRRYPAAGGHPAAEITGARDRYGRPAWRRRIRHRAVDQPAIGQHGARPAADRGGRRAVRNQRTPDHHRHQHRHRDRSGRRRGCRRDHQKRRPGAVSVESRRTRPLPILRAGDECPDAGTARARLDLRKALAEHEFVVFYQPLINIATRSVCGFEALLRWHHPQRGMVSPADFIPLAEEIGLIVPLGEWVLRQACADAASWPGNLKVAVNLSPVQFTSHTLVEDVAAALADRG